MAVTVSFDGTRVNAADALGTLWDDLAGGKTNLEPDFIYQRSSGTDGAISEKVGTSEGGVKYYDSGTSHDFSTPNQVWIAKHIATNSSALNNEGSTGGILEIGSGDRANYYRYYVVGGDTYPKRGGWLVTPITPNVTAWRDATVGTPNLNAVDNYSWACNFSATSKAENVAMDAIDIMTVGTGLTVTTSASSVATFEDILAADEGTLGNSWGILQSFTGSVQSGLIITGVITLGDSTTTLCDFADTTKSIGFAGGRGDAGYCGIDFNIEHATDSTQTIDSCLFIGLGQDDSPYQFATTADVNGTTEVITVAQVNTAYDEFVTGDAVIYTKQGGTANVGLTDLTEYWVNMITSTTLSVHTSRQNAITDTSRVNLTANGAETHFFVRGPDTRPDFQVVGNAAGSAVNWTGCSFLKFRQAIGTSGLTTSGCTFAGGKRFTQGGSTITNCIVSGQRTTAGEAFLWSNNIELITDCTFNYSQGHAIRLDSTHTTVGGPYDMDALIFSGSFGGTPGSNLVASSGSTNAMIFNDSGTALTLNILNGGTTPSVRNGAGATTTIVAGAVTTQFTVEDLAGDPIENTRVLVETADNGGGSGFPFEAGVSTLTQAAGTATLTASAAHLLATNDYVVVRGAQPDGYNKVAQITVTSSTVFTYTVPSGLSSPATGTPVFSYAPIGGVLTNASGIVSSSKAWPTSQGIKGWARKKNTSSPFYQDGPINVADASGGTTQTITLQPDE